MSDYILPEIVTQILKRLPVKSLLIFRSVCKQWCTLISTNSFISQHLASSAPNSRALVRYYSLTYMKEIYTVYDHDHIQEYGTRISFPFHDVSRNTYFSIVGYRHGLLCLLGQQNHTIVLWNPSIKRAFTLPSPAYPYQARGLSRLGFGFCSVGNEEDYKVVKLEYPGKSHVFVAPKVEVFSLSSGVWREIDNDVEWCINDNMWSDAFIAGTVHWVTFENTKSNRNNVILKFDLSSEEFCELALPGDLAGVTPIDMIATTVEGKLSVLYDCSLMEIDTTGCLSSCEVWVMKEYNNVGSWTRLFKVNLKMPVCRMMGVRRDGEMVLSGDSGELVIFDPNDGAVTETGIFCSDITYTFFFDRYVESLLLLGKGEEVQGTEPKSDSGDVHGIIEQAESITVAFKTPEIFLNNSEPMKCLRVCCS